MDNVYTAAGVSAIVVSVLLQVLKNTPLFPYLSRNSSKLNSAVSIVAAFLVSIGIIYTFDYDDNTGAFILNVHGNLWDILHTIEHTIGQWAAQQAAYKGLIVPAETLGEIRALMASVLEPPPVSAGDAKAHSESAFVQPSQVASQVSARPRGILFLPMVLVIGLAGASVACVHPVPPTPVAAVADVGARLEESASALLSQAVTASMTINPTTHQPLITRAQLDVVALAVDRGGRLGLDLKNALDDYNRVKAAGRDTSLQAATAHRILADVTTAFGDVNHAIPSGTVTTIDAALTNITTILAAIAGNAGL